jgi:hypothetical protein
LPCAITSTFMFAAIAPNAATTAIVTYDLLSIVSISFDIYVIII